MINGGTKQWGTRIPTSRTVVGIVFSCPLVCRFHDHIPGQVTTALR